MKVIAWNNTFDAVYYMTNTYVDCPVHAPGQHASTDSYAALYRSQHRTRQHILESSLCYSTLLLLPCVKT